MYITKLDIFILFVLFYKMCSLNVVLIIFSLALISYLLRNMFVETFQDEVYVDECAQLGQVINKDNERIVCRGPKRGVVYDMEKFQNNLDQCPEEMRRERLC